MNTENTGIAGWLILPLVGLFISLYVLVIGLKNDVLPSLEPEIWAALTSTNSGAYHVLWAPFIIFDVVATVSLIILLLSD